MSNIIRKQTRKKEWKTNKIVDLKEERWKYKNVNGLKYKEVNTTIRSEVRKCQEKCLEIEILNNIHDSNNILIILNVKLEK